jgi:hypothetical protein
MKIMSTKTQILNYIKLYYNFIKYYIKKYKQYQTIFDIGLKT